MQAYVPPAGAVNAPMRRVAGPWRPGSAFFDEGAEEMQLWARGHRHRCIGKPVVALRSSRCLSFVVSSRRGPRSSSRVDNFCKPLPVGFAVTTSSMLSHLVSPLPSSPLPSRLVSRTTDLQAVLISLVSSSISSPRKCSVIALFRGPLSARVVCFGVFFLARSVHIATHAITQSDDHKLRAVYPRCVV